MAVTLGGIVNCACLAPPASYLLYFRRSITRQVKHTSFFNAVGQTDFSNLLFRNPKMPRTSQTMPFKLLLGGPKKLQTVAFKNF
jgi:hypothetical protein